MKRSFDKRFVSNKSQLTERLISPKVLIRDSIENEHNMPNLDVVHMNNGRLEDASIKINNEHTLSKTTHIPNKEQLAKHHSGFVADTWKTFNGDEFSRKKRPVKASDAVILDMTISVREEQDPKVQKNIKNIDKERCPPKINDKTKNYLISLYSDQEPNNHDCEESPDMFLQDDSLNFVSQPKETEAFVHIKSNNTKETECDIFKYPQPIKIKQSASRNEKKGPNFDNGNFDMSQLFKSTQLEKIISSEFNSETNSNITNRNELLRTQNGDITQMLKSSQIDRLLQNITNTDNDKMSQKMDIESILNLEYDEGIPSNFMLKNAQDPFDSSQFFKSYALENILVNAESNNSEILNDSNILNDKHQPIYYLNTNQKCMVEENENNVSRLEVEENPNLLNAVEQSSQYKKDIQALFDICEMSICNISTDIDNIEKGNLSDQTLGLAALQGINWENDSMMFEQASKGSPVNKNVYNSLKQTFINNAQRIVEPLKQSRNGYFTDKPTFVSRGPFYDLPLKCCQLISTYKNINKLYDWQDECLKLPAIKQRKNLIYALPTSGGKTLVAEILILREILCRKKNVIFVLPFVSIVQEKIWALSPFAVALDFLVEEYAGGKGNCPPRKRRHKNSVYIATIEKSLGLLNSLCEMGRMQEIGLIVIDELHLLGEVGRGATLEIVLTKILDSKENIHIIGMSATIGNISEIAEFLNADVYTRDFRPVELKEFVKCGDNIMSVIPNARSATDLFVHSRTCEYKYTQIQIKMDPDHLGALVLEVLPESSCLIFCPTKKNCENVASLICRMFPDSLLEYKKEEKRTLRDMIKNDCGTLCATLSTTLQYGVAYHHSGLTADERKHIEDAYRAGVILVICCTSTLAAGVNLPAKRVILRSPYVGKDFITLSRYKQMVGRAGRAGFGETGESILIFAAKDTERVQNLLCSPMDEALSSLHFYNNEGLKNLILSSVGLNIAVTRTELRALINKTLMSVQADRLKVDVKQITDKTLSTLFKLGALITKEESATVRPTLMENSIILSQTQQKSQTKDVQSKQCIMVGKNTHLAISKLGKAAAKACINLKRAHMLYNDLVQAQSSLVLLDCLHLLYLVTPYEQCEQITPNIATYYSVYTKLGVNELQTAKILGINEACAIKMLSGKQVKNIPSHVLNRFYITLMLYDLWNHETVHDVSNKFQVPRGSVQSLMTSAAAFSASVLRFCEELEEFWAFKDLLINFTQRLQYCCSSELLPLMELPSVKLARAKQLYNAGYKTLNLIAKTTVNCLIQKVENLNHKTASQLISTAKLLLLEKVETLREEAEDVLDGLWAS